MTVAEAGYRPPPIGPSRRQAQAAALVVCVAVAATGFLVGRSAGHQRAGSPIALVEGVPTGVERSPAGALAAADSYLALEQQTVERDPSRFAMLVRLDYAPSIRAASLASAEAERRSDPPGITLPAGGDRSFTVIGAHRLDYYRADSAQVTTWACQIYWKPGQQPEQVWRLGQTTLAWSRARWLITGMRTVPGIAPTPASTPQADPRDDTTRLFDNLLAGFSPVSYGAPAG